MKKQRYEERGEVARKFRALKRWCARYIDGDEMFFEEINVKEEIIFHKHFITFCEHAFNKGLNGKSKG